MTTTTTDSWTLVQAAQRGDRDAFADLYTTHRGLVYSVTYARVRNPTIAEDLTAETFTRAWAKLATFHGGNVTAWLRTIADHLALDVVKSSRWRLDTTVADDQFPDTPDHHGAPELLTERACEAALIRRAIETLPPHQRRTITHRYLLELTVTETAARAGVTAGAVKAAQHRGIARLATELAAAENRATHNTVTRRQHRRALATLTGRVITRTLTGGCRWPRTCTDPVEALGHCRRHYDTLRAAGRLVSGLTNSEPIRDRITEHLNRGRTLHHLADTIRIDATALRHIHTGRVTRIRAGTAQRIMRAPLPPTHTDTIGWIHALSLAGHTQRDIATAAGIPYRTLRSALYRNTFHARLRISIASAYEQLTAGAPPVQRGAA